MVKFAISVAKQWHFAQALAVDSVSYRLTNRPSRAPLSVMDAKRPYPNLGLLGAAALSAGILTACGPGLIDAEQLESAAMATGTWGWGEGAGCESNTDVVVLTEDSVSYIKHGDPLFEARLVERSIQRENTVGAQQQGRIQASDWLYAFTDAETGELIAREDRMQVRFVATGFKGLQLAYRMERRGNGSWVRVVPTDAERWDILVPCGSGADE